MFFEKIKVSPRILQVNKSCRISGRFYEIPRDFQIGEPARLFLKYVPLSGIDRDGSVIPRSDLHDVACEFKDDGTFSFEFTPPEEGEFRFQLCIDRGNWNSVLGKFECYALEDDLFELRPLKGDTHVHSSWSACAGVDQEPAYISTQFRRRGMDFIFITDHSKRYPSVMAIQKMSSFDSNFKIYPGEECHVPYRYLDDRTFLYNATVLKGVHHLSLGADRSVVEYANEHFEEYTRDIEKRMAALPAEISKDQRQLMAGVDWLVEKIHEFGGIAIFAHPFWKTNDRLNLPPKVREYIFDTGKFDAVELIGLGSGDNKPEFYGSIVECISWLHDKSVKTGRHIPVTGATDSHHAASMAGSHYTMVFVKDNTLEEIQRAIVNGKTLACRHFSTENPFFWGEFRLVTYAEFLQRNFFPEHDAVCDVEGQLMAQALRGEIPFDVVNAVIKEGIEKLYRSYWAE